MTIVRTRLLIIITPILMASSISLSCSQSTPLHTVRGKVIFKNQPLPGALVTFHPKGKVDLKTIPSTGLTKEDGTFTLTTGEKDGAPAGEYVITIICSEQVTGKKGFLATGTGQPETEDRLKGAYANKDASRINITVKPGENQLEPFDLK